MLGRIVALTCGRYSIDINGEIKLYEENLINIDYQNNLLFLSFASKDKYKRI